MSRRKPTKGKAKAKRSAPRAMRKSPQKLDRHRELEQRLTEAEAQQAATNEVLRVIATSPADVRPVFDMIAERAMRLCGALHGGVLRFDGELIHLAAHVDSGPSFADALRRLYPMRPSRSTVGGRAILTRAVVHVPDVTADPDFVFGKSAAAGGFRSAVAVPMLKDGQALGAIVVLGDDKTPFSAQQLDLLRTFADQAVIAIENVRLIQDQETRHREQTELLEQQTATSEILKIISSSPTDVQPVFDAIARNAVTLCEPCNSGVFRFADGLIHLAAYHNWTAKEVEAVLSVFPIPPGRGSVTARAIHTRAAVHVIDLAMDPEFTATAIAQAGTRTVLSVPMLQEGQPIGAINLTRREVQPFTERQIALLQTFAAQAVIAVENVRLFTNLEARNAELRDALEQQMATSEVLKLISRSTFDLEPVLKTLVENATRLAGAEGGLIGRFDGEVFRFLTDYGASPEYREYWQRNVIPAGRGSVVGRAAHDRHTVHILDVLSDPEFELHEARRVAGYRSALAVPMLREDELVGVFFLWRTEVRAFTDKQIELVTSFADQAGIAIENARLLGELRTRNADLTESLEQQTATSEILRIISSSPTDVQPVFDAVAESAARLCDSFDAALFRLDGDRLLLVANHGPIPQGGEIGQFTFPLVRGTGSGRAVLDRQAVHIADMAAEVEEFPESSENARRMGFRTNLCVPLMREGEAIGAISLRRTEVRLFTERQVALLRTFADQAVIAIENVRLFKELETRNRDLTESLEQQTATGEVLRVISSSPTDIQPVLDTVAESAARLCAAVDAAIWRRDGDRLRIAAHHGAIPVQPTVPLIRGTSNGRTLLDRRTVHIADMQAETEEYPEGSENARLMGHRTILCVPLMREGVAIGTLQLRRTEARLFTERQVALLETFADQAVIAIENVRLFTELETRNRDLTETLEQQTATSEILRVISSSPTDVQPVLDTVAESAARLCEAFDATVWRRDGEGPLLAVAHHGPIPQQPSLALHGTVAGRAVLGGRTIHLSDVVAEAADFPGSSDNAQRMGFRTILCVPLMREGVALGTIALRRTEVRTFSERQVALLETFADQAVIAIENVRLFQELETRNRDLIETLEQQTATSEILRVISSSPIDVQPVFDTIVRSARALCSADSAGVLTYDGEMLRIESLDNANPAQAAGLRDAYPMPATRGHATGRAILTGRPAHIRDVREDPDYALDARRDAFGIRRLLSVPMVREGTPIGAITVQRWGTPRSFSENQMALLQTFADQAVIAIENVRLFRELEARNSELRVSLEQQTATSELLKVIERSTFDLQPVFETLAESAVRLCDAKRAVIWRFDGQVLHLVVTHNLSPENRKFLEQNPIAPGRGSGAGRVVLERRTVHIHDVHVDPEYTYGARDSYRTLLTIPMLRADELLGVISIHRDEVQPFTDSQIALMETFADQAAIAVENARLLTELQAKNADLTETLEQQTATSEILRVISSSPTDVQPVFDSIAQSAMRLCEAQFAAIHWFDGQLLHFTAHHGWSPEGVEALRRTFPIVPHTGSTSGRAILTRAVAHIPDALADPTYTLTAVGNVLRSTVAVPMMREGSPVGTINVSRFQAGRFSDKHIALLQTFADQAVIAIQNVRLFTELERRRQPGAGGSSTCPPRVTRTPATSWSSTTTA
jgi:GAF domain-containing protein